jgi:hypothetical protein
VECADDGVGEGVGLPAQSGGSGGFCLQEASATDPVISSTTLRDFFTGEKGLGRLAHGGGDDVANADDDRSAEDADGDIFVLAHLSFEIERGDEIKQFEAADRQDDADCAEYDRG